MKINYRGYIGNLTVRSAYPLIVYGSVRGLVSEHRSQRAAEASLRADQQGCRMQRGYSDARIYGWTNDGWA